MSAGQSLHHQIGALGAERGAEGVGVAYYDYQNRIAWGYGADRWFHAASTIKVPVLLGVFDAVEQGRLRPQSRVHVRNRFLSVSDGMPYKVEASRDANSDVQNAVGRTLQLRELARHMIVTSSNLATNLLIEIVGLKAIQKTVDRFALHGVELRRGVEDMSAFEAGINNRVTADGLLSTLRVIQEEQHFSEELRAEMLDILHAQEFRGGIPAGLPDNAKVANKTGEISTVAHDAGIVSLPKREPYIVVILTEWQPQVAQSARKDTIARISRVVYEHITDGESKS